MVLTRAALEPAHNNSCGPLLKEKSGHPWPRQNRETNATPQSSQVASPNVSLTRLKRYRYCLNHTHTHTHTHKSYFLCTQKSPEKRYPPLNLVCIIPNTRTVSTWTPHGNLKSLKRNRIRNQHTTSSDFHLCNAVSVSMTADANALFCIPWGRQITSKYRHRTTWQHAVSNSNKPRFRSGLDCDWKT